MGKPIDVLANGADFAWKDHIRKPSTSVLDTTKTLSISGLDALGVRQRMPLEQEAGAIEDSSRDQQLLRSPLSFPA